ncbi:hypothetical protein CPB86DRAFT_813011 [Serendipita vermifera]|nr:hypothetical protein CPB86DRAFT_813011 [Serendipita vermifera]
MEYMIESSFPTSAIYDPASSSSAAVSNVVNYDTMDPGGRRAIQQIIDQANGGQNDLLWKPWALHSISRVSPFKVIGGVKLGFAVTLQWQPGPTRAQNVVSSSLTTIPVTSIVRNSSGLTLPLNPSHVPTPNASIDAHPPSAGLNMDENELTGGVRGSERVVRREFPISPTFKPSDTPLHHHEIDAPARAAIKEHLHNVNGSEGDFAKVNWALYSCWKLSDKDSWFSFAIILQCMPIARALSRGKVVVPNPKPQVIYHISTLSSNRTEYMVEPPFPISAIYDPASTSGATSSHVVTYDAMDPAGRRAIQRIIDQANDGQSDLLWKPWALHSISRMSSVKLAGGIMFGFAVTLQWQPGPTRVENVVSSSLTTIPVTSIIRNPSGLTLALNPSHVPTPNASIESVTPLCLWKVMANPVNVVPTHPHTSIQLVLINPPVLVQHQASSLEILQIKL